ncbi:hypothetical protein Scep_008158 [Stephania cephalantha]|uniref:Inositol oxygenase n=1 Tax=Stephania cephalantha TaxID=152367 RepID=A0AAP0KB51_9MAGN
MEAIRGCSTGNVVPSSSSSSVVGRQKYYYSLRRNLGIGSLGVVYGPASWSANSTLRLSLPHNKSKVIVRARAVEQLKSDPARLGKLKKGFDLEDKKVHGEGERAGLDLDGGFVVPGTNSFGHTFRDYNAESERKRSVEEFYRVNHINQTYDFVQKMREEYGQLNRIEMSIWESCELLNEFVDESDPDLDEPQIEHLLQSAEAIRKDYPNEDWLHLTALIHDLGKVLLHHSFGALPQWAVVGDTFPVGCAYDESVVHHKYFKENPDYNNPAYNTKCGVYSEGCGLENVMMSWGHDDYMYLVAKESKTTLPPAALFIIRYHSFYAMHTAGAYRHLMNNEDHENLRWLKVFNKYDLYSKSKVRIDIDKVKPYYLSLIEKYFPAKLRW